MLNELFSKGNYDLPITLDKDDIREGVGTKLTAYLHDLEANGADEEVVRRVRSFRRSCAVTLQNYFKGIHSLAYDNFARAVTRLGIDKSPLLSSELGSDPLFTCSNPTSA